MVSSSFNEVEGLLECGERPQSRPRRAQWQIASSYRLSRVFVVARTVRVSAERSTPRFIVPDQDPPRAKRDTQMLLALNRLPGTPPAHSELSSSSWCAALYIPAQPTHSLSLRSHHAATSTTVSLSSQNPTDELPGARARAGHSQGRRVRRRCPSPVHLIAPRDSRLTLEQSSVRKPVLRAPARQKGFRAADDPRSASSLSTPRFAAPASARGTRKQLEL